MTDEEIATLQAQLTAAKAEVENARARIADLNGEAKGHRINSEKHKTEAEAAAKARDDAIAEAARVKAEIEAAAADKVKVSEAEKTEATKKAQERSVNADLKVAAKDAGAVDAADVLALLDRSKIKLDEAGEITNAAELMADLKKAKPHLFGAASTSSTAPKPPPSQTSTREQVKNSKPEDYRAQRAAFLASRGRPAPRDHTTTT